MSFEELVESSVADTGKHETGFLPTVRLAVGDRPNRTDRCNFGDIADAHCDGSSSRLVLCNNDDPFCYRDDSFAVAVGEESSPRA